VEFLRSIKEGFKDGKLQGLSYLLFGLYSHVALAHSYSISMACSYPLSAVSLEIYMYDFMPMSKVKLPSVTERYLLSSLSRQTSFTLN